jgi:hypothetical protein
MCNPTSACTTRPAIVFGVALTFAFLALASVANGTTYYVAKTGSNSNTCTQAQNPATAKLTINAGIACVSGGVTNAVDVGAGHTVIVKAGSYAEEMTYTVPGGTSWASPFTLKAETARAVTLYPTSGICDGGLACRIFALVAVSYVVIDGFVMNAGSVQNEAISLACTSYPTGCSHHIRIQNSEVFNPWGNCIGASGDFNEYINLTLHECGNRDVNYPSGHNAFYLSGNDNLVDGCHLYNNQGGGIMAWDVNVTPSRNVFRNNLVHDFTVLHAGNDSHVGIGLYRGTNNIAYNNIVYGIVNGPGISVDYGCTGCKVYNNTSYGNTGQNGSGVYVGSQTSGSVIRNNIAWGNAQAGIQNLGSNTTISNNLCPSGPTCAITQNPLFVDAAAKIFRLLPVSPALDTGVNLAPTVANDFDHSPRPKGCCYDIGAYEFNLLPAPPVNLRVQ